jgi:hypothetical protein
LVGEVEEGAGGVAGALFLRPEPWPNSWRGKKGFSNLLNFLRMWLSG